MPIKLDDYLSKLPPKERRAIKRLAADLIKEEATLRELRKIRARSQKQVAAQLGIKQAAVSKLERRTDMYLSTLRTLIQAMGGELDIVARFPDKSVRITQFRGMEGKVIPRG
jgi:predicted XRE-type DNA-binding protein